MLLLVAIILVVAWFALAPLDRWRHRQFPGYFGLPFLGNLLTIQRESYHGFHYLGSKTFGPVFLIWMGTIPKVVVSSAETVRQVFVKCPFRYEAPIPMQEEARSILLNGLIFITPMERHKKIRAVWNPAFTPSSLSGYYSMLVESVHKLTDVLQAVANGGHSVDIQELQHKLAMEATCLAGFGIHLECFAKDFQQYSVERIHSKEKTGTSGFEALGGALVDAYDSFLAFTRPSSTTLWMPLYVMFPMFKDQIRKLSLMFPDKSMATMAKSQLRMQEISRALIQNERAAMASEQSSETSEAVKHPNRLFPGSFLRHMLSYEDESGPLTEDEIVANITSYLGAGEETTGSGLVLIAYLLALNPEAEEKMVKEIAAFGRERVPTYDEVMDSSVLPYVEAVIKESLRLLGPAPYLLREAQQEFELRSGGKTYHVSKGTQFEVSMYSAMRDPEEWKEPLEFRPERFIPGSEWHQEGFFAPFGGGVRLCIGKSFSHMLTKLTVVRMYQRFKFELEPGVAPLKLVTGMTMGPEGKVPLKVYLR